MSGFRVVLSFKDIRESGLPSDDDPVLFIEPNEKSFPVIGIGWVNKLQGGGPMWCDGEGIVTGEVRYWAKIPEELKDIP